MHSFQSTAAHVDLFLFWRKKRKDLRYVSRNLSLFLRMNAKIRNSGHGLAMIRVEWTHFLLVEVLLFIYGKGEQSTNEVKKSLEIVEDLLT